MKDWNLFSFNKVFFAAFFVLAVINSLAVIVEDNGSIMALLKCLSIPVFLIFFYIKKNKINMLLIFFLAFAFLGESTETLFHNLNDICAQSIFYCFAFIQLIVLMLPKFNFIQVDGLIKAYLLMLFGVTVFFLKVLYDFVGIDFLNNIEAMLFTIKCFMIMILNFIAYAVYLHVQSKKSVLFLIATVCFGFSCLLDYLIFSFSNTWSFIMLNRIIYLLGIYFIFRFLIEENKGTLNPTNEVYEDFSKDRILT